MSESTDETSHMIPKEQAGLADGLDESNEGGCADPVTRPDLALFVDAMEGWREAEAPASARKIRKAQII